jgi:hypothetical protein
MSSETLVSCGKLDISNMVQDDIPFSEGDNLVY